MKFRKSIPASLQSAAEGLRRAFQSEVDNMTRIEFVQTWSQIAYLFPGLHPDSDAGDWPRALRPFHAEAQRRIATDLMDEEEFYPSDAQWSGLFDRLKDPTPSEFDRRSFIAR